MHIDLLLLHSVNYVLHLIIALFTFAMFSFCVFSNSAKSFHNIPRRWFNPKGFKYIYIYIFGEDN